MRITHPPLLDQIKEFMDVSVRRQEVISSNLANVDTPGYRARRVRFVRLLKTELSDPWMDASGERFLSAGTRMQVKIDRKGSAGALGNDRNNVSLDGEMTELAQNLLKFSVVTEIYQKKIQLIRHGIREGRS